MSTVIYYYTGTGNSLWVACRLAAATGNAEVVFMSERSGAVRAIAPESVGLVFPVYIWGVPAPVIRFVNTLESLERGYFFAVAVNAGQVSNTLVQLKEVMARRNLKLSSGFQIKMPSNYIPWGGPGSKDEQGRRFRLAQEKINSIAGKVKKKEVLPVEKGPLWQRIVFSAIYKISFPQVPRMDRHFWTDEKCNSCGICAQICPAFNITMQEGKPAWSHRCEQCLACLQWCPQEAIQYGRKTTKYERYHHPEISLKDILDPLR